VELDDFGQRETINARDVYKSWGVPVSVVKIFGPIDRLI